MRLGSCFLVLVSLVTMLAGCGGGGSASPSGTSGGGSNNTTASIVSGVAATGTPIAGTVYLKDSSSPAKELSTTINADGSFSFDVTGLTAPFLLKAVGSANGQNYTLYSFAGAPGTANINPLSHLAVVQANSGADPASLYAQPTAAQLQAMRTAIATIIPQIQALLQQVLSQYGVASTNFISDSYKANHTGLDLLFDMIAFLVNNGSLTVSNKMSGSLILTTTLNGNTLSGQIITANLPSAPAQAVGAVYVYPATVSVTAGGTASFKAVVVGAANQTITWSVVESAGGSITSTGVYTAPATAGTYHVQATSAADTSKSASATITVTAITSTSTTSLLSKVSDIVIPNATINSISYVDSVKDVVVNTTNNLYVIDASNLNSLAIKKTIAAATSSNWMIPDSSGVFFATSGANNYLDLTSMTLAAKTMPSTGSAFYNGDSGQIMAGTTNVSLTLASGRTVSMSKTALYYYLNLYNGSALLASIGNND